MASLVVVVVVVMREVHALTVTGSLVHSHTRSVGIAHQHTTNLTGRRADTALRPASPPARCCRPPTALSSLSPSPSPLHSYCSVSPRCYRRLFPLIVFSVVLLNVHFLLLSFVFFFVSVILC
ncbi:hypothetical protein E2C01_096841 [Portunus trituberculatus]|uniref:Secreted protein n=1 Tax=Portunus trituberculatus TaxID=210409 RepID=A0A5B7JWP0_PORTR|nr:hypothetical protein [Portunus trituberculatus]